MDIVNLIKHGANTEKGLKQMIFEEEKLGVI